MAADASSDGAPETPQVPEGDWDPTKEEYRAFLKEHEGSISERQTVVQNAVNIAGKLKLVLMMQHQMPDAAAEKKSWAIVNKYIDELASTMHARIRMEGENVRDQFLALSQTAPKEIRDALAEAKKENPEWYDMHEEQLETILEHFAPPDNMQDGKFIEGEKEEKGLSYLSSDRWLGRPSIDGDLVKRDWEIFRKIHAVPGTKEQAALDSIEHHMKNLYDMDRSNLTFVNTTPTLRPGARFAWSFLLAGAATFSLLMARKTKRFPKKGLLAFGLLAYLNRNRDSKLSFLSGPRYEVLTKELQGSEAGRKVFNAIADTGNRTALKEFAIRERKRFSLPAQERGELPESEESYATLADELGFGKESAEAKRLRAMSFADIEELGKTLQKFSEEELEVAEQFVRRKIDPLQDAANIPLEEPATL